MVATNSSLSRMKNSLAQDLTIQRPISSSKISAVQSLATKSALEWIMSHSLKLQHQMLITEKRNQLFLIARLLMGLVPPRGLKAWAPNSFLGLAPILKRQSLVLRVKAKHSPCAWSRIEPQTCLHLALERMNLNKTRHWQQAQAGRLDLQQEMMLTSRGCVQATSHHQTPITLTLRQ